MASENYVSHIDGITADDLEIATTPLNLYGGAKVYLANMATGERTLVLAAMVDKEGEDAPNLYLYTEII